MRKKIASSIIAATLAVTAVPAVSPVEAAAATTDQLTANANAAAGNASEASEAINRGIEKAFDPNESSSLKEDSFKGFMQMLFEPYQQMFSGDLETSSQGVTRTIINYVIIAAGVTIIGQAIQIAMANMPR